MWLGYPLQTLVLWFWLYMMLRMVFLKVYRQILPLLMLRGRNHLEHRDWLMWVPSVLPVRGLPSIILLFHNSLRLAFHILFSNRPRAPSRSYDQAYMPSALALPYHATQGIEKPPVSYSAIGQPCYTAQFAVRPTTSYPRLRAQQTSALFAFRRQR